MDAPLLFRILPFPYLAILREAIFFLSPHVASTKLPFKLHQTYCSQAEMWHITGCLFHTIQKKSSKVPPPSLMLKSLKTVKKILWLFFSYLIANKSTFDFKMKVLIFICKEKVVFHITKVNVFFKKMLLSPLPIFTKWLWAPQKADLNSDSSFKVPNYSPFSLPQLKSPK